MKNMFLALLGLLLIAGCEKQAVTPLTTQTDTALDFRSQANKIDVCHYSEEDGSWHVINISPNALAAHQAHGDAVDMDGDGFFDKENGCSDVDCDGDTKYDPDNSCRCVVEGELEVSIDPDGTPGTGDEYSLFVHPEDQVTGLPVNNLGVDWAGAVAACATLAEETGCEWYLPTREELAAMYDELGPLGENNFDGYYYWSSSEFSEVSAFFWRFLNGGQGRTTKSRRDMSCRCVRR